jgi:hypothetical protein
VGTRPAASLHLKSMVGGVAVLLHHSTTSRVPDLCDIIRGRDARSWIENRRRKRERDKQEQHDERDDDYYDPYYGQPHRWHSLEGGHILGGVKAYSLDLKRVR